MAMTIILVMKTDQNKVEVVNHVVDLIRADAILVPGAGMTTGVPMHHVVSLGIVS